MTNLQGKTQIELRRIANQAVINQDSCDTSCYYTGLDCCGNLRYMKERNWWHSFSSVPCFVCSHGEFIDIPIHPQDPLQERLPLNYFS